MLCITSLEGGSAFKQKCLSSVLCTSFEDCFAIQQEADRHVHSGACSEVPSMHEHLVAVIE